MKIGIITFHFVSNQGAVLQCYAMQKYLESQGHEAYVINYQPSYHTVRYAAVKNPFIYARNTWKTNKGTSLIMRVCYWGYSFLRCCGLNLKGEDKKVQREFEEFMLRNFNLTDKYTTFNELVKSPPQFDAYISGSDQLWNPELLDQEFDGAYFLEFGPQNIPRITYAVSMGKEQNEKIKSELKKHCENLTAVSLREYSESSIKATGRDVHICIDPTLLLDSCEYDRIAKPNEEKEPYIFVYGFETTAEILEAVKLAQDKYNVKIINGSPHRVKLNCECSSVREYAPDKFLSYIKNAECVVTNSFHASVFSIIYQKDFITVAHSTRGLRMHELLGKLGLNCRLWNSNEFNLDKTIEWKDVAENIIKYRTQSTQFLKLALSGVRGEEIPHSDNVEVDYFEKSKVKYDELKAKYGYFKDDSLLKESASGGIATALAQTVISKYNGKVYGVAYNDGFKSSEYKRAETLKELEQFKGSKYFEANKKMSDGQTVYASVAKDLTDGHKVLFTGLGCEVGALKKYLEVHNVDTGNLFTVDIICHGPTFAKVHEEFISSLEEKYSSKIVEFSMRYKKKGWTPPYVRAVFANKKCYLKPFYETDLGYAFKTYSKNSCFNCQFKGKNHVADITIGDYWGIKSAMPEFNKNGVSIMLIRSKKGEELLKNIDTEQFLLGDANVDFAIENNKMFEQSRKKPYYYDKFENDFKQHGLHYACVNSPGYKIYKKTALKNRIKRVLKNI